MGSYSWIRFSKGWLWGYRPIYLHGSAWATPDKVAQLARKVCVGLRTARWTVRSKQRLLGSRKRSRLE
jgi:hypothetical protein